MKKQKHPPTHVPDTTEEAPKKGGKPSLVTAPSLKPSEAMMIAAAEGQPEACAIRDAWKFKQPVKKLSREEFAALCERGSVSFGG